MKFDEWVLDDNINEVEIDKAIERLKEESDNARCRRIKRQIQELQAKIEELRKQCPRENI